MRRIQVSDLVEALKAEGYGEDTIEEHIQLCVNRGFFTVEDGEIVGGLTPGGKRALAALLVFAQLGRPT